MNSNENNKPKTARQKKVLVASILLAGLITVGGTFAWFSSTDEVSNRLTATANYGVSITEDFTPTDNWTPGQTVNKDVYAVNTGNVPAFLKVALENNFTLTVPDAPITMTNTITDPTNADTNGEKVRTFTTSYTAPSSSTTLVELTDAERETIESGGRLVYPYNYKTYTYTENDTTTGTKYQETLTTYFNEGTGTSASKTVTSEDGTTIYKYTYTKNETTIKDGEEKVTQAGKIEVTEYSNSQIINDDSTDSVADWTPTETGVYIFKRNDSKYVGYYYVKGDSTNAGKYYALDTISITTTDTDTGLISALTTKLKTEVTLGSTSTGNDFKVEFLKGDSSYISTGSPSEGLDSGSYLTAQVSFKDPANNSSTQTIKVYIYLDKDYATYWTINDENSSGTSSNTTSDNLAFYYNSILESGETSHKLVDKILLDPTITNGTFNTLTYDLDVVLDSIQAVINENGVYSIVSVSSDTSSTWKMTPSTDGTKAVTWTTQAS